ncbi:MAG: hypothetical protein IT373_35175 [Polyangiaceae bacterium]|nr:hypothetical protein [Polyangiaceae bacterium]
MFVTIAGRALALATLLALAGCAGDPAAATDAGAPPPPVVPPGPPPPPSAPPAAPDAGPPGRPPPGPAMPPGDAVGVVRGIYMKTVVPGTGPELGADDVAIARVSSWSPRVESSWRQAPSAIPPHGWYTDNHAINPAIRLKGRAMKVGEKRHVWLLRDEFGPLPSHAGGPKMPDILYEIELLEVRPPPKPLDANERKLPADALTAEKTRFRYRFLGPRAPAPPPSKYVVAPTYVYACWRLASGAPARSAWDDSGSVHLTLDDTTGDGWDELTSMLADGERVRVWPGTRSSFDLPGADVLDEVVCDIELVTAVRVAK